MLSKVRLALLGREDVAQRDYLQEFHRVADRVELVAVCGRTERRRARWPRRKGSVRDIVPPQRRPAARCHGLFAPVSHEHPGPGAPVRETREFSAALSGQPYLKGNHLTIEEPHVYADIIDLADAIREDRLPRSTGEQSRHGVEIIEKGQVAARMGQPQYLSRSF